MLRKIRVAFASIFFTAITLLFLDFTGSIHAWLGWMAHIQFVPAILALHAGIVLLLLLLTFILGRAYCSIICPLGVMQDLIAWINGRRKKKKYRFTYSPEKKGLRYSVLGIFIIALVAGIGSIATLLEPYSAYGRMAANLLSPLYAWGNNLLAYFAERVDSYAFYTTDVWLKSLPTFTIACITFIIIGILAWRNGRTYCNTICPVGTVLGMVARYSLFRPTIDTTRCNHCHLCVRRCKAACIDSHNQQIDYSRCVVCMDCLDTCRHGAIRYTYRFHRQPARSASTDTTSAIDTSRRQFLSVATLAATTAVVKAQDKKVDGGLATIEDKKIPNRNTPIVPPGAGSARNFAQHCTACQLCVSVCPNHVLRPSTDLVRLMQPEMSYERGYCRPECTQCADVCPAGAIHPISVADKSATQIGHAVWIKANCVPLTDGVECGNCARHCPSGAIQMIPSQSDDPKSLKIPAIDVERCIGCGACENLCPSRPFSAIYVEGHHAHRTI